MVDRMVAHGRKRLQIVAKWEIVAQGEQKVAHRNKF